MRTTGWRFALSGPTAKTKAAWPAASKDFAITQDCPRSLDRPQRRLLRRIYNGRTVPIVVDDRPFLTYKEASGYLLSLPDDAREQAYQAMKSGAINGSNGPT